MRALQGFFRACKHRHFGIAKLRGIERITSGLLDIHISCNGANGQNLNLGRAQRHDQRNGIIGSSIGVNQKWKFHATQDNKLSGENSGQKFSWNLREKYLPSYATSGQSAFSANNCQTRFG